MNRKQQINSVQRIGIGLAAIVSTLSPAIVFAGVTQVDEAHTSWKIKKNFLAKQLAPEMFQMFTTLNDIGRTCSSPEVYYFPDCNSFSCTNDDGMIVANSKLEEKAADDFENWIRTFYFDESKKICEGNRCTFTIEGNESCTVINNTYVYGDQYNIEHADNVNYMPNVDTFIYTDDALGKMEITQKDRTLKNGVLIQKPADYVREQNVHEQKPQKSKWSGGDVTNEVTRPLKSKSSYSEYPSTIGENKNSQRKWPIHIGFSIPIVSSMSDPKTPMGTATKNKLAEIYGEPGSVHPSIQQNMSVSGIPIFFSMGNLEWNISVLPYKSASTRDYYYLGGTWNFTEKHEVKKYMAGLNYRIIVDKNECHTFIVGAGADLSEHTFSLSSHPQTWEYGYPHNYVFDDRKIVLNERIRPYALLGYEFSGKKGSLLDFLSLGVSFTVSPHKLTGMGGSYLIGDQINSAGNQVKWTEVFGGYNIKIKKEF